MYRHEQSLLHLTHGHPLNGLYASMALRSFAFGLIDLFIPIYLLKLGIPLPTVLIFFASIHVIHALCVLPAARLISRLGARYAILVTIPFFLLFYIFLYTLPLFHWPLLILAVLFGCANPLFWVSYHLEFLQRSSSGHRGSQLSTFHFILSLAHAAAPFLGGVVLAFSGFPILFFFTSCLLFLSVFPLFLSQDIQKQTLPSSLKELCKGQTKKNAATFFLHGAEQAVGSVLWPLFIFFSILKNITLLGLASSLSLTATLLATLVTKFFSDLHRRGIIAIGTFANAASWIARSLFVTTSPLVFVSNIFHGVAHVFVIIPFDTKVYEKSEKKYGLGLILLMEMLFHLGKATLFLFFSIITSFFASFLFAGALSFIYLIF